MVLRTTLEKLKEVHERGLQRGVEGLRKYPRGLKNKVETQQASQERRVEHQDCQFLTNLLRNKNMKGETLRIFEQIRSWLPQKRLIIPRHGNADSQK